MDGRREKKSTLIGQNLFIGLIFPNFWVVLFDPIRSVVGAGSCGQSLPQSRGPRLGAEAAVAFTKVSMKDHEGVCPYPGEPDDCQY